MSEENAEMKRGQRAPTAEVRSGRSLSIIWVVPVLALLIGGWLGIKAWSEQGPVITITFETADGLEADKTKIKFKEVEIGLVTKVEMNDDLTGVIVTAEMDKGAEKYMRDQTLFWVIRARVVAGEVSGLDTLFSGAYIGCNPSKKGDVVSEFKGLEKPPVITSGMPGRHFVLEAETLGSLDVGSPVYYRGIKVGQVVEYDFNEQAEAINVRVFINAPFHEKVRQNTRFWNASGIDFSLNTEGISVDTQSLVSLLLGGVAFDLPKYLPQVEPAGKDQVFYLYANQDDIQERSYRVKLHYMMYFDQNVRGLSIGAPVEIRGIKIGEVVDIKLEVNVGDVTARVAVLAVIEPERIDNVIEKGTSINSEKASLSSLEAQGTILHFIENGLRAQLKNSNLLTGQLYVDFDFYPEAEPFVMLQRGGYQVMPTLPAPFEQIAQRVSDILKQIEKVPFNEIAQDLHTSIKAIHGTLKAAEQVAGGVNEEILPALKKALDGFQSTMDGIDSTFGQGSAMDHNTRAVLSEMTATIRSLRTLIDNVENNPQSLIFGKEAE